MRRSAVIALAGAAALAACTEPKDGVPEVEKSDVEAVANTPAEGLPPAAAPPSAPKATTAATLPRPLLGAWTADRTGDCTSDNELRIDVSPGRIDFYESRARIMSVTQVGPHSWGVDADVSGEGETRSESFDLNLNENGSMTRVEAPDPDVTYTRCPGTAR